MNNYKQQAFYLFLLIVLTYSTLFGAMEFYGENSTINISPNATFNNNSNSLTISGKLIRQDDGNITGNPIIFSEGKVKTEELDIDITGSFKWHNFITTKCTAKTKKFTSKRYK